MFNRAYYSRLLVLLIILTFFPAGRIIFAQEDFKEMVQIEADYILQCQYLKPQNPADGCINNAFGAPTCIIPGENASAILGLVAASSILEQPHYLEKAQVCADYLVRVQDQDGAWYNQYYYQNPGDAANLDNKETLAKSPIQTAKVLVALNKLGYDPSRYSSVKKGALYLVSCQNNGGNGYLLGAGKDPDGNFRNWRWAADNAYSYQALKAAETWALIAKDTKAAVYFGRAARKIIDGIDQYLYISDQQSLDHGVWYRVVDENNIPVDPLHHDWINYAPAMLDVPCRGAKKRVVGDWIHNNLQNMNGACVWDDANNKLKQSPGLSFQATLCWRDLGQAKYYFPALEWALHSGLWQTRVDFQGALGGWVDWTNSSIDPVESAKLWERFVDTSFYSIAAFNGGYDFNVMPGFLRINYTKQKDNSGKPGYYLQLQAPDIEN